MPRKINELIAYSDKLDIEIAKFEKSIINLEKGNQTTFTVKRNLLNKLFEQTKTQRNILKGMKNENLAQTAECLSIVKSLSQRSLEMTNLKIDQHKYHYETFMQDYAASIFQIRKIEDKEFQTKIAKGYLACLAKISEEFVAVDQQALIAMHKTLLNNIVLQNQNTSSSNEDKLIPAITKNLEEGDFDLYAADDMINIIIEELFLTSKESLTKELLEKKLQSIITLLHENQHTNEFTIKACDVAMDLITKMRLSVQKDEVEIALDMYIMKFAVEKDAATALNAKLSSANIAKSLGIKSLLTSSEVKTVEPSSSPQAISNDNFSFSSINIPKAAGTTPPSQKNTLKSPNGFEFNTSEEVMKRYLNSNKLEILNDIRNIRP